MLKQNSFALVMKFILVHCVEQLSMFSAISLCEYSRVEFAIL